jgi:hypothetical protein
MCCWSSCCAFVTCSLTWVCFNYYQFCSVDPVIIGLEINYHLIFVNNVFKKINFHVNRFFKSCPICHLQLNGMHTWAAYSFYWLSLSWFNYYQFCSVDPVIIGLEINYHLMIIFICYTDRNLGIWRAQVFRFVILHVYICIRYYTVLTRLFCSPKANSLEILPFSEQKLSQVTHTH